MRPQGLKPALILGALRGAEAPLFHGTARTCGFSATSKPAPFPSPPHRIFSRL